MYNRVHLDLWLQVSCCGYNLWALNEEHLDYMESFVKAMLRGRLQDDFGWHNLKVCFPRNIYVKFKVTSCIEVEEYNITN